MDVIVMEKKQDDNEAEKPSYLEQLIKTDPIRESTIRSIIKELQPPTGSSGLDVGCGVGTQALMLADAVGPKGRIIGVDVSNEFLSYAQSVTKKAGKSKQVTFQEGDMNDLPFEDNIFDWAWSMDCAGYHPDEPLIPLKEMVRVVKPGGFVTILGWTSEMLLPGFPLLEKKLGTTDPGLAPFKKGMDPKKHFCGALWMLQEIGLKDLLVRTFLGDIHAPLSEKSREALILLIDMRWEGVESELSDEDILQFHQLCDPKSDEFILNLPHYYAYFIYSQFSGKVGESGKW
jgi:demethylmenaquinone methyltransferase/2-methoxy-6-polyprenyl-1,4-benzoquinol methylase